MSKYSLRGLLSLGYEDRTIIKGNYNVKGELRNLFFADAFTVSFDPTPNSGYDRIENGRCYRSQDNICFVIIENSHKNMFDYLVLTLFDETLALCRALYMPREVAEKACMLQDCGKFTLARIDLNNINQIPGVRDETAHIAQNLKSSTKFKTLTI